MPRISRGCLRCRQRRVKCDGGRPACQRCVTRGEICAGYREESDLVFRNETEKTVSRANPPAPSSVNDPAPSLSTTTEEASSHSSRLSERSYQTTRRTSVDSSLANWRPSNSLLATIYSRSTESSQPPQVAPSAYPWLKSPPTSASLIEERAVHGFFNKYVLYPCNERSSPGFLEHLPSMFKEVNVDGRYGLRYAVQATAFADISREHPDPSLAIRAFDCYGKALEALGRSLGRSGKTPDDYDLMTVVVLDIFETLFMSDCAKGAHAEAMAHILRLRGHDQFHDPRGWGLFRLAHHRLQKAQLAYQLRPSKFSDTIMDQLNDDLAIVRAEKDAQAISTACDRGRQLVSRLSTEDLPLGEFIAIVREMHKLDSAAVSWRRGPEWAFQTLRKAELYGDADIISTFPDAVEVHRDVWSAYEWNYHRAARMLMHEQILSCLRRASSACSVSLDDVSADAALLHPLEQESVATICALADRILATVPQSFGDIDEQGRVRETNKTPGTRAIGAYLLLWPIKVLKGPNSQGTDKQRAAAKEVFERIRDYTGMKKHLGDLSLI